MSLDIRPNPSATGVTGGLVYKGSYNATTNLPDLTTSVQGDFYIVSVGGTLAGVTLNVGDHIVFNQNASSPITSAMFDVIDNTDAVASVNGQTGVVVLDSDDISEGATNQYFTSARFDSQLATKDSDDITEGATNQYFTSSRFDSSFSAKSTTDLSEGTNLYFTDARADARIGAASVNDLSDVAVTTPSNGQALIYNSTSGDWENSALPSAPVTSVNTQTGAVVLDTDDVSEGSTNLYYTDGRFDTRLATKSTTDLSEGTNLYYTDGRFDTRLAAKSTTDLSEGTNLYFTDARADARADVRIAAANIDDLNDVTVTTPSNGQVLLYNSTSSEWENGAVPSAPVTSVNTQTGAVSLDLDDVVTVGATTTTAITTGGLTVTGDIDPNADVTYYIGDENNRFISYYGDMNGAIRFKAKVDQTGGLSKGEVVYINGLSGGGSVPTVAKAQANSSSTMPAFGLVYASANDTADVEIITFGNLEGLVTNTFTAGTNLYVSSTTAGGLVNSAPTGESNLIQNIGFVVKSDASAGIIKVGGAGRTNATPNLDQDKIFLGNGSNQAVSTALSSVNLSSFNQDLTTSNVSEGTNLYYTDARFDTRLGTKSTTDLSEGTNLYYTDARADARIGAADLTDLNDVSYTAGPSIDNYVLTFDNSTSTWGAEAVAPTPPNVTTDSSGTNTTISTTTGAEEVHLISNGSSAVTITIPTAATSGSGYRYHIKRLGTANVTVQTSSGTIDAQSNYVLSNTYESVTVVSDGSNYFVI